MYFIPIVTIHTPGFFGFSGSEISYTLSSIASLCSNTFVAALGGSARQQYTDIFYIGWIVAIVFVIDGLTSK
jgi:hypothetical protein